GDILVVTLTPDQYVDKGPHRPAFNQELRAEALASLECVDYVAINLWPTAEETLRRLLPQVYVKGAEYKGLTTDMTGKIVRENAVIEEIGAELVFTDDIVFSSTKLINRYLSSFEENIQTYLRLFRKRYTLDQVLEGIDRLAELKVLVLGETILDEYQFCSALGKSSKEPILALQYQSHDVFAGGVLAVANHVAGFARQVKLVTALGEVDSHEAFIRSQLKENVTPHFYYQPGSPTLIKRRFIEGYTLNKLFEIYVMDDSGLPPAVNRRLRRDLGRELAEYDLVVSADFGHGLITQGLIEDLTQKAKYLAVNTQANAGNRGFHTISRYRSADFISLAEPELRLEMRDLRSGVAPLMNAVRKKTGCRQLAVTQGKNGCVILGRQGGIIQVPSFAPRTVDRIGAGDAFFSISALASVIGLPDEILGFLGNVAGALAVEILGNAKYIDQLGVKKFVVSLLK
ncbi:MAG: PfkB family carbohydrate kinase, partial [Thermodesulfobacteriota bacterium]